MNLEELKKLTDKIIKNGIAIKDKEYLKGLYQNDDYDNLFNELNEILNEFEIIENERLNKNEIKHFKQYYAFTFYIGFFNINSEQRIDELPKITEPDSYKYLKGGLMLYFKDKMKIKYNYPKVTPYNNKYSFVADWYPQPFSTHYSLINLLEWVCLHDEKHFYNLIFNEKHNHIFLSTLKGRVIRNFKINPKYIDWKCNDDIKLYGLFNYLLYPYSDVWNLNLKKEDFNIWRFNIKLINRINNERLIKIIIDYIKYQETKIIPLELVDIVKDNLEHFYKEYDEVKILNINEIHQLYSIKHWSFLSKSKLFELILKKLKLKLSEEHITINENDWEKFLDNLDIDEINKILRLLKKMRDNLNYISELDKEIRFKKYLIDLMKYNKINELISICNEELGVLI